MDQEQIDSLLADKLALDQMYGSTIRELHECKKQLILTQGQIIKLTQKNEELKKELESAKDAQMHIIALESQSIPDNGQ